MVTKYTLNNITVIRLVKSTGEAFAEDCNWLINSIPVLYTTTHNLNVRRNDVF